MATLPASLPHATHRRAYGELIALAETARGLLAVGDDAQALAAVTALVAVAAEMPGDGRSPSATVAGEARAAAALIELGAGARAAASLSRAEAAVRRIRAAAA